MNSRQIDRRDVLRLLGGALFVRSASSLARPKSVAVSLTSRLQQFVQARQIAGAVALVSRSGRPVYFEAIGEQSIEDHTPMRTNTIFDIRSMTKAVTAVAIMCLMEDGRLKLEDYISDSLPEFGSIRVQRPGEPPRPPVRPITLLDLLTHTSGMGEDRPKEITNITRVLDRTLADVVKIVATQPLKADPGAPWKYASMGYAVLGRVVELRSGKPYQDFIAERILGPLKMMDSFFFPPRDKWSRLAAMYNMENGKLSRDSIDIYRKGALYSAPEFGMFSTARDMERFFRMMLDGGSLDGKRVLSDQSVRAMLQPRVPTPLDGVAQGLAWFICIDPEKQSALLLSKDSFGDAGASGTFGWIDPGEKMIRLFLIQRFGGSNTERNTFMSLSADIKD
jgi:CubicO group peptidase (beta-lactamase class C family)